MNMGFSSIGEYIATDISPNLDRTVTCIDVKPARATIVKIDEEQQIVFGWANVSIKSSGEQVIDSYEHKIDPKDLELAAYSFVLSFGDMGVMHKGGVQGKLIESFMVTEDKLEKMGLGSDALPLGWWVGFYIEDKKLFEKVKNGEYSMFSIQGTARVVEE